MGFYVVQNDEVIAATAAHHGFHGDTFWWKINRHDRHITDEATGQVYDIPDAIPLGDSSPKVPSEPQPREGALKMFTTTSIDRAVRTEQ